MPVFKCAECGNIVEDEAPPEKCDCGAKFSYDEVYDFEKAPDTDEIDDEQDISEPDEEIEDIF